MNHTAFKNIYFEAYEEDFLTSNINSNNKLNDNDINY